MDYYNDKISRYLREDGTLVIYLGNSILTTVEDGQDDEKFVEDVLFGMGYNWNEDGTISEIKGE